VTPGRLTADFDYRFRFTSREAFRCAWSITKSSDIRSHEVAASTHDHRGVPVLGGPSGLSLELLLETQVLWPSPPPHARSRASGRTEPPSLLTARVEVSDGRRPVWLPLEPPSPLVVWSESERTESLPPASHLDLSREIGFRLQVLSGMDGDDMVIQWHHACCDGIAMVSVVHELLIAYASARTTDRSNLSLPELDPSRLARRGSYDLTVLKLLAMLPGQLVGLLGVRQYLMRSPCAVIPHEPGADDAPVRRAIQRFSPARSTSKRPGGTAARPRPPA